MTRTGRFLFGVLLLASAAIAQDASSTRYENKELGVTFSGVYGWDRVVPSGSGAWTTLATYSSDRSLDSSVVLLVRDNPYDSIAAMRSAMQAEFKASEAEPTAEKPVYKEVVFTDADMKEGIKLPAVQAEAVRLEITEEGKRRERVLIVRTYFGKNRLFRIHCEARRARAKRVRDLFDRALSGLVVEATDERTSRGTPLRSVQGKYECEIPETYTVIRGSKTWRQDILFENRKEGVLISIYAYTYDGILADQIEEMIDYYGGAIKMDNEEARVMGDTGFLATITKDKQVTIVTGSVQNDHCYRIHTTFRPQNADAARRAHEFVASTFKATK